ncbi:MAG TPA: hypothetical protein VMD28_03555 [Acidimicrobiales bacterium]|nr:hypothetical protein [Acidimicrobiales bacterium]
MSMRTNGRPITRADLEAAFQKVVGEGGKAAESAAPTALVVAAAGAFCVVALAYLAGRRRGGRKSSVVEIRRI